MQVYTIQEVADILKVDYFTIYRLVRDNKLKTFRVGRLWRITEEELQRFTLQHVEDKLNE